MSTILLTALSATTATVSSTIAKHLTKKFLDKFEKENTTTAKDYNGTFFMK